MTTLTKATIHQVSTQVENYLDWIDRESINTSNCDVFNKVFDEDIDWMQKEGNAKPLIDVLSNRGQVYVTGSNGMTGTDFSGNPQWHVHVGFGSFELLFSWITDNDNGRETCAEQTVVIYGHDGLNEEQRCEIECIFGVKCDEICDLIMKGKLKESPETPEFSSELFLEAEKFYLYFSKESAAQQAASTTLLGEQHV
ncbi:hypothetical protein FWP33_13065 [Vibrio parahaemolyticus]|jgi:hypothetical protein|uniref:Uncharacterized protein n=1 Tax=Vibrio jasicida TaxID=766224 RepID=A0AAU9QP56_9VIBR|nr:hypothetical protein [Vibrio parahaemolyticus]EJC7175924.1 hypothetical protein [Vibrio parahaemolyticus]EJG0009656.1 hypothetical protein [Vibrio parahaemolyticus]CAH1592536.1 hypothetical protein THF1C08_320022 [Vibrio jasicida]CAH1597350.1 hypothetical protein THF1A12_320022 [Vibrio jasicida]